MNGFDAHEVEAVPSTPARTYPAPSRPVAVVIGVDVLDRRRFVATCERFGDRFLDRVFTPGERALFGNRTARLAGRFAAKEACAKALGTGIGAIAWKEIEIVRLPGGKPALQLSGYAAERAAGLGITAFDVSISDTHEQALAVVVGVRDESAR